MRIIIDMQGAQSASRFRGIGNYTRSLVAAMVQERGDHEVLLVLNGMLPESIPEIRRQFGPVIGQHRIVEWQGAPGVAGFNLPHSARRRASEIIRERFIQSLSADRLLCSTHFEGFVDDTVTSIGHTVSALPTSLIAYDLIPAIYPDTYLSNPIYRSFYEEKLAQFRRADQLLCISESTRDEVRAILGLADSKLHVINAGVSEAFERVDRAQSLAGAGRSLGKYILYPGGLDGRKNLERLIVAFGKISAPASEQLNLVIVGQVEPNDQERIAGWMRSANVSPARVILTGFVPDESLVSLYTCAKLVVFPSFHEGFGLPLLEAMRCDTPVIGADAPGTREILALPAAMFDPHDTASITRLIEKSLTDQSFREALVAHGRETLQRYSWAQSARLAWAALETPAPVPPTLIEQPRRPRLAYISPLPPERTGIADYSAELLPALAAHYEIDCVTQQATIDRTGIAGVSRFVDAASFATHAANYDRVVYHIGNSPFHTHMFALLQRFPGVVVLHDQFLGSFLRYAEQNLGWTNGFWRALYKSHGWPALIDRAARSDVATIERWPASREVIDRALGVISHSAFAREIAETVYSETFARRWRVVHFPRVPQPDRPDVTQREDGKAFRVSTFGFVDDPKCPLELIDAWSLTPMSKRDDCELVFVGENEGGAFGQSVVARIAELGLQASVRITGFASPEEYRAALFNTDVAVQLRKITRGETSAAVFDCLSAGLPLIVNGLGSMKELPADVVKRIPDVVTPESIAAVLTSLWQAPEERRVLGERAIVHVSERHAPAVVSSEMRDAIEEMYAGNGKMATQTLRDLSKPASPIEHLNPAELSLIARAVAINHQTLSHQRTVFVDISAIVATQKLTGMERTSRALLDQLLKAISPAFRIEPVFATKDAGYRTASAYLSNRYGIPHNIIESQDISPSAGDILLILDWQPEISKLHRAARAQFRARGAAVVFFVFDLLPLLSPQWFPGFVHDAHAEWMNCIAAGDGAICITKTVAEDLQAELSRSIYTVDPRFEFGWLHLGCDIPVAHQDSASDATANGETPFVLMVGTVEPRKGYRQAIDAFERAWAEGEQTRLVIVGSKGWMVDELIDRMTALTQTEPRFIWHTQANDALLTQLYRRCCGLMMASEGEGFGLPLIEAARFGKPLLVRDLPVFREVCGRFASYFSDDAPDKFATSIRQWISKSADPNATATNAMPVLTWAESAAVLAAMLTNREHEQWLGGDRRKTEKAKSHKAAKAVDSLRLGDPI